VTWNLAGLPAWFSVPGPRQAWHPGLRAGQIGNASPVLAAPERLPGGGFAPRPGTPRALRAGRVAPGGQLIRGDRDPPSILNRAESARPLVIIQEYEGSH
jgi:hypothetical protein